MAKKARVSIADELARLSAQGPAPAAVISDNVITSPRDNVASSNAERDSVATAAREVVGPDGYKRRVRYEKPHASVYAHPRVFKALREIAAAQDCKPHDLYLEGLRLVLRAHGRDFDTLNRGE